MLSHWRVRFRFVLQSCNHALFTHYLTLYWEWDLGLFYHHKTYCPFLTLHPFHLQIHQWGAGHLPQGRQAWPWVGLLRCDQSDHGGICRQTRCLWLPADSGHLGVPGADLRLPSGECLLPSLLPCRGNFSVVWDNKMKYFCRLSGKWRFILIWSLVVGFICIILNLYKHSSSSEIAVLCRTNVFANVDFSVWY